MANWKILLGASFFFVGASLFSFRTHLRTPVKKRTEGINQPFIFISLLASGIVIISTLFFFLDK